MKPVSVFLAFFSIMAIGFAQKIPSSEWQIQTALMAVPKAYKTGATVYGYNPSGELITLRKGQNEFIALADDPKKKGFSVAAYKKELDAFMERGRQLRAQGKEFKEVFEIREAEVKAGTLSLPDKSTLYVFTGDVNPETQEIENTYLRYVFYIPYATGESTGLPTEPTPPGHPWLMDAGTHRAHIMMSPPKKQ